MLVWRREQVGGRGDFLFELYGKEKKTHGCKILLLRVKKMGRLSALHPASLLASDLEHLHEEKGKSVVKYKGNHFDVYKKKQNKKTNKKNY